MNLLEWLSHQSLFPKVYYCDKESGVERAAIGALRLFSTPPQEEMRCYGGLSFPSQKKEKQWDAFGMCRFWQPVQEIVQERAPVVQSPIDPEMRFQKKSTILHAQESVSLTTFTEQIDCLKQQIERGAVEKVVLARRRSLTLNEAPSVWELLAQLKAKSHNATLFAFQMDATSSFFGATPETFFRRNGRSLTIDAVAGSSTGVMGKKEAKEFAYVKQFIQSAVAPFATSLHWQAKEQLLSISHLHHLYNVAYLDVDENFSDAALIHALHPTPAVGGVKRDTALAWIEALESFQRGWYASPVGYLSQGETHLCVGLRSALLYANQLHLFAGAGIVADSLALKEWEEIDLKMELLSELFSSSH